MTSIWHKRAYANKILRRAHIVGSSVVITLHPSLVQKFQASDPMTFFEEVATAEGILLKPKRISEEKGVMVVPATATESDYNEHNHIPS